MIRPVRFTQQTEQLLLNDESSVPRAESTTPVSAFFIVSIHYVCDHVILPAQFFNFLDLLPTPHSEMGVLLLRFMEFVGRVHNLLKSLQILL